MRLLSLVLLAACAAPKAPTDDAVEVLTDDAVVSEQHLGGATLSLPYEIINGGGAPATLDAIEWRATLDGEQAQNGSSTPATPIAAGGKLSAALEVPLTVDTSDEAFARRAAARAQRFVINATFQLATGAGPTEYVAEWTGELFPSRRPTVTVQPQAMRSEGNVELHFVLGIKNPNAFDLPVERLGYTIVVEGTEIASGELASGQKVAAGSELQFDVTRFVGRDDHVELAKKILKQPAIAYAVKSELETSGRTFVETHEASMSF